MRGLLQVSEVWNRVGIVVTMAADAAYKVGDLFNGIAVRIMDY